MENGNRKQLYVITFLLSMALLTLGVASAWASPVLPKFEKNETDFSVTKNEFATMFSMNPIGFTVGSLAAGYIADKFGRRATILGSALPFAIGSMIVVFALKAWLMFVTSFSWGCGTGMVSTVSNVYLFEIADKDVRGRLSVITSIMFKFGTLFSMSVGPFLSYDTLNYIMLVLPFLYFAACWWIPETPYYCLKTGNLEDARKSLQLLRGYTDEKVLEDELLALQAHVKNEVRHSGSVKELFTGVQYRRAIIIATGLRLTQIMTGAVVIRHYLGWIISETKLKLELTVAFIIYGAVGFVVGIMSSVLIDRVGRRPLLVFSYIGTGVSLFAVGLYFFLQEVTNVSQDTLTIFGFVPLLGIILANVISTVGFNSLIFIIPAEIFPLNVKAVAMTCLSIFGAALAIIISLGYQRVKDYCGLATVFWIFAAVAFGGGVFCYFLVTETKGKHLRDIQAELQGDRYDAVELNELDVVVADHDEKEGTEMDELKTKETNGIIFTKKL